MTSTREELRKLSHKRFHVIWKVVQAGDLNDLNEEERSIGRIMLEHEEYHNQFEIADHLSEHEYDPETEANPFLHIAFHQIVENQLEAKDPIEVYQFFNAMRKKKRSRHDVIHLIGSIISGLLYTSMKEKKEFDLERYRTLLKRFKDRNPERVWSLIEQEFDSET